MPGAYRSLSAWKYADELFFEIHRLTKAFPREERYELTSQLRRAGLSVPTNIVEGTARFGVRERVHFLRTSWTSLAEIEYLISVAERLTYVSVADREGVERLIARTAGALRGLIASVARSAS